MIATSDCMCTVVEMTELPLLGGMPQRCLARGGEVCTKVRDTEGLGIKTF